MNRFMRKCVMDRKIVQLLLKNTSSNKIAAELKVSKKRIKKVKSQAEDMGYFDGIDLPKYPLAIFEYNEEQVLRSSPVDSTLLEHKEWIVERRMAGWHLVTIWEELPVKVTKSSFYRFIKRHKIDADREKVRCRVKVVGEIIHAPAEALILDWGKLKDVIDPKTGKKRTVWFLAGVMGHSRYMMVRLVWDNKTETTLRQIESMFNEMGGVPQKIISDNPKCFAVKASKYEPVLNPAFERFCDHYRTLPEILPPRTPEIKGKVERVVPYVRRLFEAYEHDDWSELSLAQEYMDYKVKIANERQHGTTKLQPVETFLTTEANELTILPSTSFELEEYHQGKVRKDGCVRFRSKHYSVGKENVGCDVFIIGNKELVQIYKDGKLLETHQRVKSPYQNKSIKEHHLEPYEQIITNCEHYLSQALKIGPSTQELVKSILLSGNGFVDTRKVWGILSLDKSYKKKDIDLACEKALMCDDLSYRTVLSYLELRPSKKIKSTNTSSKFTRDMSEYYH